MAKKRTGLGRNLGSILDEIGSNYESQFNEAVSEDKTESLVTNIDIDDIDPNPYQPRKHFDKDRLQELSESIVKHGLLQPIVVLEHDNRYILIAGERRLRASKIANLSTIKAIVADIELDELRLRELALIENIQRENLNAIELANSYKELIEVHSITHEELSSIVHKSRSQITNTLRLLNLEEYAQEAIIKNQISQGHAKILVTMPKEKQKLLVDTIIGQKLSVRDLENISKKIKNGVSINKAKKSSTKYTIPKDLASQIEALLPFETKVKRGSVEILLDTKEQLEKFITFIKEASKN